MYAELFRQVVTGGVILVAMTIAVVAVAIIAVAAATLLSMLMDSIMRLLRTNKPQLQVLDPPDEWGETDSTTAGARDDAESRRFQFGVGSELMSAELLKTFGVMSLSLGVDSDPTDVDHVAYLALAAAKKASPRLMAGLYNDRGYALAREGRWKEAEASFATALNLLSESGLWPEVTIGQLFAMDCQEAVALGLCAENDALCAAQLAGHPWLQFPYFYQVVCNHETAEMRVLADDGLKALEQYVTGFNPSTYRQPSERIADLMTAGNIFRQKLAKTPYRWIMAVCFFDIAVSCAWCDVDSSGIVNLLKEAHKIAQAADEPWQGFRQSIVEALTIYEPSACT